MPNADLLELENELDEETTKLPRAEALRFASAVALPAIVALLAAASGFAPLVSGARGWTALFLLPVYLGVFLAALMWPLKHARWLPSAEHPERLLSAIALSAIPLLSFTYFIGNYRDLSQAWDAVIAVLPPLAVGWIAFRRSGRESWFAALAGGASFFSLFVFNDALGPFRTVFACAPYGQLFHSLRTLAAFGGIALAAYGLVTTLSSQRRSLVLLAAASFALDFILPKALAGFDQEIPLPTYAWIGFLAALYFLYRPTEFARKAFLAIACLEAFAISLRIGVHIGAPSASLGAQAQLALEAITFGYFASVVACAWQTRSKLAYRSSTSTAEA